MGESNKRKLKLPVDLDELHAGFSRAISKEHGKKRKKKYDIAKGEYMHDVSPHDAERHLKVDDDEAGSSTSSSSSSDSSDSSSS